MKINWKVRLKSKPFCVSFISASLLLIQVVLVPFGIDFKFDVLNDQLLAIVNALFSLLTILGIVVDPTVRGIADSERALSYEIPMANCKNTEEEN